MIVIEYLEVNETRRKYTIVGVSTILNFDFFYLLWIYISITNFFLIIIIHFHFWTYASSCMYSHGLHWLTTIDLVSFLDWNWQLVQWIVNSFFLFFSKIFRRRWHFHCALVTCQQWYICSTRFPLLTTDQGTRARYASRKWCLSSLARDRLAPPATILSKYIYSFLFKKKKQIV